jgi:trehalose/maltose hydrolase-like predicted phosphorylase
MYPSLLLLHPEVAKSVLDYRTKTLPGARSNALNHGYQGVFFPWNGAGTGDLESECHSWNPPHCLTQIHLQGDIALAAWQYYLATGDVVAARPRLATAQGPRRVLGGPRQRE